MTNSSTNPPTPADRKSAAASSDPRDAIGSLLSTVSGPSTADLTAEDAETLPTEALQRLGAKKAAGEALVVAMPFNAGKDAEHGLTNGHSPPPGMTHDSTEPVVGASTVSEDIASEKLGDGTPALGVNVTNGPLDRVRVDSTGQALTTNQGTMVADNQNSLKAGLRGPVLIEDFVLREKITHFDHERIPERVVHARGSAAHGYFECYSALTQLTRAAPFRTEGKRTPVFARFSTVAGERGSADTVRDVRGFAVKFYTDEGIWDLVGNNIPVFFIQDAMKFPDLAHALKPEPNNGIPQASSAHDTFWDFVSLMPESAHMLLWVMSDRALPRSYRTMQGFGVHTFRLVNADGDSVFCKFHWTPTAGTHSLVWDEAVKIAGADADFHRRDLWESIEAGVYPEYELGLQVFTEQQAEGFDFDVLDSTKLIPEELVPIRPVGRMVLDRNPDNFFSETEQVAFCTHHVVPGIDFSNDPLLQGRNHSYLDTQLSRLGGPNFHEIPINSPIAQVHNNQRDGLHRQAIPRGRVAYEPNSIAGGCPFQAGMRGFVPFPAPVHEDKVRGKPEKFAEHYAQARLFWLSQTPVEQNHIAAAFRFELTRVQLEAVRERVVSMLVNVHPDLAQRVADDLGIAVPAAMPRVLGIEPPAAEVETSAALSMFARPGDMKIRGRRVALLVVEGVDADSLREVHRVLVEQQAVPRFVGARLGRLTAAAGAPIDVEVTLETAPSVLWDAVVLPDGTAAATKLAGLGRALEFVKDQYRHCKPILALGSGADVLAAAMIPSQLPDGSADPGVVRSTGSTADAATAFVTALGKHRVFERETDPPVV